MKKFFHYYLKSFCKLHVRIIMPSNFAAFKTDSPNQAIRHKQNLPACDSRKS